MIRPLQRLLHNATAKLVFIMIRDGSDAIERAVLNAIMLFAPYW